MFGATHAWNFMVLGFVTLAFAGGWRLARAEGGDPLTGAVALALSAPFLGSLASGLTEDGALGLGALGLSLSVGAVRETHPWRAGLLGGACLRCSLAAVST